ncbi:hypothetical protein EV361DRAFT_1037887 [Lentinula raphanica]|nr:hypothetical protein EV361DRAFT_1037887 [Lentinula raphanica]
MRDDEEEAENDDGDEEKQKADENEDEEDLNVLAGDVHLKWYIGSDGPTDETPEKAKNLWASIVKKFPFFPRLHSLLVGRPNIEPPAITTGFGPQGMATVFYQPQSLPYRSPLGPADNVEERDAGFHTLLEAIEFAQQQCATADSTVNGKTNNPITNIPDYSTFNIPEGFPFSREPSPAPAPAPAPVPEATPSRKPVLQAQEKINMARNAITPRNQKSSRLEDTLLTITSQHLEHSKEENLRKLDQENKKLRLETMSTFERRRDGIMRQFDLKLLTAEWCS